MKNTHRFGTTLFTLAAMATLSVQTPQVQGQIQRATLLAGDGAIGDSLGQGVDVSGDYAIVGASNEGPLATSGAAYIYVRSGSTWTQQAKIKPAGLQAGNRFGLSVAIDGDTAVIGAPLHTTDIANSGAVWVYTRSGAVWSQQAMLIASDRLAAARFGDAVAIDGERIIVGATSHGGTGRAYVFDRGGGVWTQSAILADAESLDDYGYSVAVSGNRVVVGARGDDGASNFDDDAGAAHVYTFNGSTWSPPTTLRAGAPDSFAAFGWSVAIDADSIAIGAPLDDEGAPDAGAMYVYEWTGSLWQETAKRLGSAASSFDALGATVAIDGDVVVAGAPTFGSNSGAVYLFRRDGGAWNESPLRPISAYLAPYTQDADQFGTSIAIDGATFLVGAIGNERATSPGAGTLDNFGAAYVFEVYETVSGGDTDGDGMSDEDELFVADGGPCPDPLNPDSDGDGLLDGIENEGFLGTNTCLADNPGGGDSDGDGVDDTLDNCPTTFNPDQANFDGDSQGDACDLDDDNDGRDDSLEISPPFGYYASNPLDPDTDDDGQNDGEEAALGTNPNLADSDGDGLSDSIEAPAGCPHPTIADSDGDGLLDGMEVNAGWDPCDMDSDGDTLSDGAEVNTHGTNPSNPDTDGDSLNDGAEVALAAGGGCPSPLDADSDNDGIEDGDEITAGSGPCDADSDNDGLSDGNESAYGTSPTDPDSDNDGLLDGAEVDTGCTNPLVADSDGDTLSDGAEAAAGTNPCNIDTDGDSLPDNVDPHPLTPAMTPAMLAQLTLCAAGGVLDTPVNQFLGPNNSVKQARRALLAGQIALGAIAINCHNYNAARALLTLSLTRVDGGHPSPDWMADGSAKNQVRSDLETIMVLLDLID